jgi:hypothetical protein
VVLVDFVQLLSNWWRGKFRICLVLDLDEIYTVTVGAGGAGGVVVVILMGQMGLML